MKLFYLLWLLCCAAYRNDVVMKSQNPLQPNDEWIGWGLFVRLCCISCYRSIKSAPFSPLRPWQRTLMPFHHLAVVVCPQPCAHDNFFSIFCISFLSEAEGRDYFLWVDIQRFAVKKISLPLIIVIPSMNASFEYCSFTCIIDALTQILANWLLLLFTHNVFIYLCMPYSLCDSQ